MNAIFTEQEEKGRGAEKSHRRRWGQEANPVPLTTNQSGWLACAVLEVTEGGRTEEVRKMR